MAYIIRVIVMYLIWWTGIRLIGRKSISEMTTYDLAAVMLMTSVAAEPITYKITSKSIVGVTILVIISGIVGRLSLKRFFYNMDSKPILVILDGKIIEEGLRSGEMSIPLLLSELRISGYTDVSDIKYAYLEPSGQISIIPKSEERPLTPKTMGIEVPPVHLMLPIIVDGRVQETNLNFLQKDLKWLNKQLKNHNVKNIKDVLLAQYDTSGDLIMNLKDQEFDIPKLI